MSKLKDGYWKQLNSKTGDDNYLLKAAGGYIGLHTGRNNEANKVVRTDENGYIQAGWINTTSGSLGTTAPDRIYASNDAYVRYITPANFFSNLSNSGTTLSVTIAGYNRTLTVAYASSAGNAASVARATFGDNSNGEHNANNIASNGLWYYTSNGPSTTLGASTNDGALYSQAYSTSWVGQIAQDYRNGQLFVRGKNNGTWQSWLKVYDSGNLTKSVITGLIGSTTYAPYNSAGYLPLAGGTMNANAVISRTGSSVSWYQGRVYPLVKTTSYTGYNSILSMKTTNGSWDLGVYSSDTAYLTYITDTNYNAGTDSIKYQLTFPKATGTLALTSNITKSAVGLGNVANYDQSKAIKSITRSGTTFTYTCLDGTTGTFTQQDNNTTYSAGTGLTLSGTTFSNSGVHSVTINGNYLRVNTNGTNADLTIPYASSAGNADTVDGYHIVVTSSPGSDSNTFYVIV